MFLPEYDWPLTVTDMHQMHAIYFGGEVALSIVRRQAGHGTFLQSPLSFFTAKAVGFCSLSGCKLFIGFPAVWWQNTANDVDTWIHPAHSLICSPRTKVPPSPHPAWYRLSSQGLTMH